jgi:hypothetical protein
MSENHSRRCGAMGAVCRSICATAAARRHRRARAVGATRAQGLRLRADSASLSHSRPAALSRAGRRLAFGSLQHQHDYYCRYIVVFLLWLLVVDRFACCCCCCCCCVVRDRLKRDSSEPLMDALAKLYAYNGEYEHTLHIYLRLRRGDAFGLIASVGIGF